MKKTLGFGFWAILALLIPAVASAQTISVTSCPSTVAPGETVNVTWSISGGTGSVTHNHVHYGYSSSTVNQYYTAHTYSTPYKVGFAAPASGTIYLKVDSIKGGKAFQSAVYTVRVVMPTVATPTFSPAAPQTFTNTISVSISCATSGATIRYTTSGSDPTASSTVYSGSLTLSSTTTLKAKAFKSGMTDSAVASGTYTKLAVVATPTFSPAPPQTFTSTISVSISSATSGATIRYTTNGSDPTSSSSVYAGSLTLSATTTLKAKAFKSGMTDSAVASGTYTKVPPPTVATPTFSPAAPQTFTSTISVSISCATSGATVRYTTNGSDPTSSSSVYAGSLTLSATTTLKAKAFKSGMTDSAVASGTYTKVPPPTVATPTFSPAAPQTFTSTIAVSISCATSGATIRYTTNGTDPTASSTVYSSPLTLSATTMLKAKAFKSGMTDSAVATGTYTISFGKILGVDLTDQNATSRKTNTCPGFLQKVATSGGKVKVTATKDSKPWKTGDPTWLAWASNNGKPEWIYSIPGNGAATTVFTGMTSDSQASATLTLYPLSKVTIDYDFKTGKGLEKADWLNKLRDMTGFFDSLQDKLGVAKKDRAKVDLTFSGHFETYNVDKENSPNVDRFYSLGVNGRLGVDSPYIPVPGLAIPASKLVKFGAYWKLGAGINGSGQVTVDGAKNPSRTTGSLTLGADGSCSAALMAEANLPGVAGFGGKLEGTVSVSGSVAATPDLVQKCIVLQPSVSIDPLTVTGSIYGSIAGVWKWEITPKNGWTVLPRFAPTLPPTTLALPKA